MKNNHLSRFEDIAQNLVEGAFRRLFSDQVLPGDLASRLARAMEDSQQNGMAADIYEVGLHPEDYSLMTAEGPELPDQLSNYLLGLARQAGLALADSPAIRFVPDLSIGRRQVSVHSSYSSSAGDETKSQFIDREKLGLHPLKEVDAYLIIDGKRHVSLNQPLLTIGRRIDNDIVIESPSVSRHHAQIRWRYGRFVIYDLGSRGGTRVNGQPVSESVLHNGDVIFLSSVPLIYGEGLAEDDRERPRPASSSDTTWTRH
jgi:hypothetical protein